jgi:hypothetical protein
MTSAPQNGAISPLSEIADVLADFLAGYARSVSS